MTDQRTVLFVCQHGAAKSVLASELLRRRAAELGLDIAADAAGIDPGDAIAEGVLQLLPDRAEDLRRRRPRQVEQGAVDAASVTVTFNVEAEALPGTPGMRLSWDDVPAVGEDPIAARDVIERHLDELVERLRT